MNRGVKQIAKTLSDSKAFGRLVGALESLDGKRPFLLRILTYHRVDTPQSRPSLYPRVTVTPQAFEQQMRFLTTNYHPIGIPELLESIDTASPRQLPPRAVLVTFDDAYRDFAEQAWPIMQRYNVPATLFVPTDYPDHPGRAFWWDKIYQALQSTPRRDELITPAGMLPLATAVQREAALVTIRDTVKILPHADAMAWVDQICDELDGVPPEPSVLSWEDLRQLARQGVTLGAHSRSHPLVNRISVQEAQAEALGSLHDLQEQVGDVPPIFAYPSGGFNDAVVRGLEEAGFKLAFTTDRGLNDWQTADRLRLRRINVGPGTTLPTLRAQLLPWSQPLSRFLS